MDWDNTGIQPRGLKSTGTNQISHGGTAVSDEDKGEFPRGSQRIASAGSFRIQASETHIQFVITFLATCLTAETNQSELLSPW